MSELRVNKVTPRSGTTVTIGDSGEHLALAGNIGLGGATPTTSGTGITFPATASASTNGNTLDDYEEGTWTPVLNGFTETGTSTASGRYTKIGRIVYFSLQVSTTGGTIAGTILSSYISGLPFQVSYDTTGVQGGKANWTSAFKGIVLIFNDESIYPETFPAQGDDILITGFYET